MKKNSIGLGTLLLFWTTAVLWSVKCVIALSRGQLQGWDPIIALLWIAVAVKWTGRYLAEKKEKEENEN